MEMSKKHIFSEVEKNVFIDILKKYNSVVECKKTDGNSLQKKNSAWYKIAGEYNASPHVSRQVTSKQLRRLWMNLKQRQREKLTAERQHRLSTGDGPSTNDAEMDADISQLTTGPFVSIDGVIDSDTVSETSINHLLDDTEEKEKAIIKPNTPLCSLSPHLPAASVLAPSVSRNAASSSTIHRKVALFKASLIKKEYNDRKRRADDIHLLEKELLREKIREAKAKAELVELILEKEKCLI